MNAKKIAEMLREIASFFASDEGCTNAIYDAQIAIANELDPPEPKPEPAFKVGDWVDVKCDPTYGCLMIEEVTQSNGFTMYYCRSFKNGLTAWTHTELRKLDPSEVIVHIGCLEGTVAPGYSDTTIMIVPIGYDGIGDVAVIPVTMLDTQTRELVDSLLRAQEEK